MTWSVSNEPGSYYINFAEQQGYDTYYWAQNDPPRWELEFTHTYPPDEIHCGTVPYARFYENGTIEIAFNGQRIFQAPDPGATTNMAKLYIEAKQGVGDEGGNVIEDATHGCNIVINLEFIYDADNSSSGN